MILYLTGAIVLYLGVGAFVAWAVARVGASSGTAADAWPVDSGRRVA